MPIERLLTGGIHSRFAALDVEEPAEQPTSTAPAKPIYAIEPSTTSEDPEEKLFALFCLFYDLSRLRQFLMNLWKDYLHNKIDLITVAGTTNTAFQLAIRTQDEILAAYPDCGDYQDVLSIMVKVLSPNQTVGGDEMEFEIDADMAEWLYAPAHSILDSFCDVLMPGMCHSGQ
jgi:hypothetical protein